MAVGPIQNEQDYISAISRIKLLWGSQKDTPEGNELDKLITLVEAYEMVHNPIAPPDIKKL